MTKKWITIGSIISLLVLALVIIGSFGSSSQAAPTIQVTPAHVLKQVEIIQRAVVEIEQIFNSGMEVAIKADAQVSVAESVGQKLTKPKLYSPRQIDRPPIGKDKPLVYIDEAKKRISDPRELDIMLGLLTWTKGGDFQTSLRKQALAWFRHESSKEKPLSPKQYAWAGYVTQALKYPDPYTIVELYPYGKPQR